MVVCGRVFTPEVLDRINAVVREQPQGSRAGLARQVCDWLDWRSAKGQAKAVSCRVALGRLAEAWTDQFASCRVVRVRFSGSSFAQTRLQGASKLEGTVQGIG